ncbi:hypothetical protein PbB2_00895 [Candidatus Phycosocius bacilliformis]|uniref:Outer membrane protein beta-barrel domain-containing protein n=1 Tax=Candidatus Phycosocius bacilliformis TaxID=1445552 RepID=A0A2P2E840_9PROT|nr:hypothetical protein [Candidatus Phycosocius bacilliformis]GBF57231.1 hypothetical protein PbB2_00895 [Candidatus Phycosocius bacilliformis]
MRCLLGFAALALLASPALAESPFSFGGSVGYEFPVDGKILDRTGGTSVNLTTLNPSLAGTGILRLRGTDYKDSHDGTLAATVEVRYALSQMSEVFGALSYRQANGKVADIGCIEVVVGGVTNCNTPLRAAFSDFKQAGVELGYRQWLTSGIMSERLFPYYAVRAGVTQTDALTAQVTTNVGAVTNASIGTWKLYDDKVTYMVGADLGATYLIAPSAELGAEVGVRYYSKLSDNDTNLTALGLANANNKSERITIPVSVRLNAAF